MAQLELSEKNLADIKAHSESRMTLTDLVKVLEQDEIVVYMVSPFRPTGTSLRIDVIRDDFERYMELQRAPGPIDGKWQPMEYAYVQY